jgi:hypothetical protein
MNQLSGPYHYNTAPLISSEEGQAAIGPIYTIIWESYDSAWERWVRILADNPGTDRRCRASFISSRVRIELKQRLNGVDGISINEALGFPVLRVVDKVNVRFKKFRKNLEPSNIPTQQQMKWNAQLELPGLPAEEARITVGYRLNSVGSAITDIAAAYWIGNELIWSFPIPRPGGEEPMRMPLGDSPNIPNAPMVRPKDEGQETDMVS